MSKSADLYAVTRQSVYGHKRGIEVCATEFIMVMASDYDALQQRLTVAEQRAGELEGLLRKAQQFVEAWDDDSQDWMDLSSAISNAIPCNSSCALKPAAEGEGS